MKNTLKLKKLIIMGYVSYIIYFLIGSTLPFILHKEIGYDYSSSFDTASFYGKEESSDRVKLLETSSSAWEERIRLLNSAQDSIILSTFDFRSDESGKDILSILYNSANNGVKIKLLLDGFNYWHHIAGDSYFYILASHPNIEIKIYNKINFIMPWTLQGRMHDKYLIIDNMAYIIGGRNTHDYFLGNYPTDYKNYDREVLVINSNYLDRDLKHSSLWGIEAYFMELWNCRYSTPFEGIPFPIIAFDQSNYIKNLGLRYTALKKLHPDLFSSYTYEADTFPCSKITLLRNPINPLTKEPVVYYSLLRLIENSEKAIIHTPYVICDNSMYRDLTSLAKKLPNIRLVINSTANGANLFTSSDYLHNKDKLIATGITIYEYDGINSYHSKSLLLNDRLSIIGSYNLDMRSTYLNTELMLVVDSVELGNELKKHMIDIENNCRKVIDEDSYEDKEDFTVKEMHQSKAFLLKLLGFIIKPIRFLL